MYTFNVTPPCAINKRLLRNFLLGCCSTQTARKGKNAMWRSQRYGMSGFHNNFGAPLVCTEHSSPRRRHISTGELQIVNKHYGDRIKRYLELDSIHHYSDPSSRYMMEDSVEEAYTAVDLLMILNSYAHTHIEAIDTNSFPPRRELFPDEDTQVQLPRNEALVQKCGSQICLQVSCTPYNNCHGQ